SSTGDRSRPRMRSTSTVAGVYVRSEASTRPSLSGHVGKQRIERGLPGERRVQNPDQVDELARGRVAPARPETAEGARHPFRRAHAIGEPRAHHAQPRDLETPYLGGNAVEHATANLQASLRGVVGKRIWLGLDGLDASSTARALAPKRVNVQKLAA